MFVLCSSSKSVVYLLVMSTLSTVVNASARSVMSSSGGLDGASPSWSVSSARGSRLMVLGTWGVLNVPMREVVCGMRTFGAVDGVRR